VTTEVVTPPVRSLLHRNRAGWLMAPTRVQSRASDRSLGRYWILIAVLVPFYVAAVGEADRIIARKPASMIVKPSEFAADSVNVLSSTASGGRVRPLWPRAHSSPSSVVLALLFGIPVPASTVAVFWSALHQWRLPGRLSVPGDPWPSCSSSGLPESDSRLPCRLVIVYRADVPVAICMLRNYRNGARYRAGLWMA
jgi:hypothetical protein